MSNINLQTYYYNRLAGFEIITSKFLTKPGPPKEILRYDWRERLTRNYNRWGSRPLSGGVQLESLERTIYPEIPSDEVIVMGVERCMIMHPAALARIEAEWMNTLEDKINKYFPDPEMPWSRFGARSKK